jgi:hypothetical protein
MIRLLVLSLMLFLPFSAISAVDNSLQSRQVQLLTHAKSLHDMNSSLEDMQATENLRKICDFQLQGQRIPASCFAAIDLELKVGLLSKAKQESTRKWLIENCLERVDETHSLPELEAARSAVPGDCQKQVIRRIRELKYMAVTQNPAELFRSRFED